MLYLIAHRGDSAHAPENTLSSFRSAKSKGAQCVEFDVMLTKDGEAIVFHDEEVDRTTNGHGRVEELDLEYIRSLDAGEWFSQEFKNERVPTLVEVIKLLVELDLDANIELKPSGNSAMQTTLTVIDQIKEHWPADKKPPLISSFNSQCINLAHQFAPEYPRALLVSEWSNDYIDLAREYGCVGINLNYQDLLSAEIVQTIKQAGFFTYAYTVNSVDLAKELDALGVDGIFSDNPLLMKECILFAAAGRHVFFQQKRTVVNAVAAEPSLQNCVIL